MNIGKLLILCGAAIAAIAGLSGCYTMLYPPPGEIYGYGAGDSVVVVPDSLAGRNITIINQNQMILDRYYMDPFYYRGGFRGGYGYYWDPYYYNPYGWRRYHHWHNGRYYEPESPPAQPPPKKERRKEDVRDPDSPRGEGPPAIAPNLAMQQPLPVEQVEPKEAPGDSSRAGLNPDTSRADTSKTEPPGRTLRAAGNEAPSVADKPAGPPKKTDGEGKKKRRGSARDR